MRRKRIIPKCSLPQIDDKGQTFECPKCGIVFTVEGLMVDWGPPMVTCLEWFMPGFSGPDYAMKIAEMMEKVCQ